MKTIAQAYAFAHDVAAKYVSANETHPQVILIFTDAGPVPVHAITADGIAGKLDLAAVHRRLADLAHGAPVALITECWMVDSTLSPEHARYSEHVAKGVMPCSDVPEQYRGECIMFNFRTAGGTQLLATATIDRAARTLAKPDLIDTANPAPGHSYAGRFVG